MANFADWFESGSLLFWTIACIFFLVVEGLTRGLTTIWFSAGSFAAIISVPLGAGVIVQFVVFLAVSLLLLIFTRKIFIQKLQTGHEKTNVNALIGVKAVLTKDIKAFEVGKINLNGQEWSAVCEDRGMELAAGTEVLVIRIEGVKAVVCPVK